jgi:hypothetical protein
MSAKQSAGVHFQAKAELSSALACLFPRHPEANQCPAWLGIDYSKLSRSSQAYKV